MVQKSEPGKRLLSPILEGKYLEIAQRNQVESPLLRLPPELRRIIFGYLLGGEILKPEKGQDNEVFTRVSLNKLRSLEVCHQLYHEFRLLPFTLNTFDMCPTPLADSGWLDALAPEQREAIEKIQIHPSINILHCRRVLFMPTAYFGGTIYLPAQISRQLTKIHLIATIGSEMWTEDPCHPYTLRYFHPLAEWKDIYTKRIKADRGDKVVVTYELKDLYVEKFNEELAAARLSCLESE